MEHCKCSNCQRESPFQIARERQEAGLPRLTIGPLARALAAQAAQKDAAAAPVPASERRRANAAAFDQLFGTMHSRELALPEDPSPRHPAEDCAAGTEQDASSALE